MSIEVRDYNFLLAFGLWLLVMVAAGLLSLLVALAVSISAHGISKGPTVVMRTVSRGISDLLGMSWNRIYALALLTFKESHRRRAFWVLAIFIALFMFGGWFLGSSDRVVPAKPYVGFVMTAMNFMLVLMTLLLACWGIPADIKARSLHTVVTKPVRRSEIVVGRMLGYSAVISVVLAATSVVGYFWIWAQVPARSQNQLISRVVRYGLMSYVDANGNPGRAVNVGDVWDYRQFIEGGTNSRARWEFQNLDVDRLRKYGGLRLEQSFEAFRTYKGDVTKQVRFQIELVNPTTGQRVRYKTFPVNERKAETVGSNAESVEGESTSNVVEIPEVLTYRDDFAADAENKQANLFDDLISDGRLYVEIYAVEPQQYIGCAQKDLFVRLPDRPFVVSYAKACGGLWLLCVLLVILGTTASCFLKGPVATLFTSTLVFVGYVFRDTIHEQLDLLSRNQQVIGGGPFESWYRLITQMSATETLPQSMGTRILTGLDQGVFLVYRVIEAVIPNVKYFNMSDYPANGFDVPLVQGLLPSVVITVGYLIPFVILGYFSLQLRELEHK